MNGKKKIPLRYRLWILLVISIAIPLLLMWIFSVNQAYRLQEKNIDDAINTELNVISSEINTYLNSINHMSLQLINDKETSRGLQAYFKEQGAAKINALENLNRKIGIYEASNPTISYITYYYINESGIHIVNNTIMKEKLPAPELLFYTKNKADFYGPHYTFSKASRHLVLSVIRKIELGNQIPLYLYIETGFKQLPTFSATTLDSLDAVYATISKTGTITYSSREELLPSLSPAPRDYDQVVLGGESYRAYGLDAKDSWDLVVYVPEKTYRQQINRLNFGFMFLLISIAFISLVVAYFIQRSVQRPLKLFGENLKLVMKNDGTSQLTTIHITEFDDNFLYLQHMRDHIGKLIASVQEEQQEKQQLELNELLHKINPHFLYNTLHTLSCYSHEKGYEDIEGFVSALNHLFMYNLENRAETTIGEELAAIEKYIELQKLKYDLLVTIENNLPQTLLESEIPRFILQPIVENAIFHGIEGKGTIQILLNMVSEGMISIAIQNNGHPISGETIETILQHKMPQFYGSQYGIGLKYVTRMLESMFPNSHQFRIFVNEEQETVFEIIVPFSKGGYYA